MSGAEGARRRLGLQPLILDEDDLVAIDNAAADADLISSLAAELPSEQFDALRARVLDERSYVEIADELGCSQAVVRKRVSRALTTLRLNRGGQS